MSDRMWYEDYQKELQEEQSPKSHEEILQDMQTSSESVFDPKTAPKQTHIWVDRGLKLSCEGAGHAYHQAWKRVRMY